MAATAAAMVVACVVAPADSFAAPAKAPAPDAEEYRRWIAAMKEAPRGPFARIRWFCEDGSVQSPRRGCRGRGDGIQHGEWSEEALALRAAGYEIANVMAELEATDFVGPSADLARLKQIILERFLMRLDDGWIFRGARSYRGALQAEDEEAGAAAVVDAIMSDPRWWKDGRVLLLREVVRLLPAEPRTEDASADDVRRRALRLARADPGFMNLRTKIHGLPDGGDAQRVRDFARDQGRRRLRADYERLADDIEKLYGTPRVMGRLLRAASSLPDGTVKDAVLSRTARLDTAAGPADRLRMSSQLLALLRKYSDQWRSAEQRRAAIQASLRLEQEMYVAGNQLVAGLSSTTRRTRLSWLRASLDGLYGIGLLSERQVLALRSSVKGLTERRGALSIDTYREELGYLARASEWADGTLRLQFGEAADHLATIEPLVRIHSQDRLRASPFLFYSTVIDALLFDAGVQAGLSHQVFGRSVGSGLRALNPGIARGVLRIRPPRPGAAFDPNGIYLLPETIAELPPVAGILTRGAGSSLSHVQLLARNLGIPNVVVQERDVLRRLEGFDGARVVMAVSPRGVVQIVADGARWDALLGTSDEPRVSRIEVDPDKLRLERMDLLSLDDLRTGDSGEVVGPKSANLGELRARFGKDVPQGVVIPFGVFRSLLDRPLEPGGPSVFEWMRTRYRRIAEAGAGPDSRMVRDFLTRLRRWIGEVDLGVAFEARLAGALRRALGPDRTYGVFVRSDTNVEDLPGFTGAGLNLTVPNVVGFDAILRAVRRVWASPFTERAYAWRQAHMSRPELVFPAVLIQRAFPSQKSGVMVTTDVDRRRAGWLTIAVNEGVGGAVDGQAAESLLVHRESGRTRVLAQATASRRRELAPRGGIRERSASGRDRVLSSDEIRRLLQLANQTERDFPGLVGADGKRRPADIEFGFRDGKLAILQIRPFVESQEARTSEFLATLDRGLDERGALPVDLDRIPVPVPAVRG